MADVSLAMVLLSQNEYPDPNGVIATAARLGVGLVAIAIAG